MLLNFFRTAYRSLIRNKSYTLINIIGLGVGIAACLLIFLVVQFETSFDDFHRQKDKIWRIVTRFKSEDGFSYSPGVPFPVSRALRVDYPQLQHVASILGSGDGEIMIPLGKDFQSFKKLKEEQIFFAEPEFFNVFDFDWLSGDKKTALNEPNTAIVSKATAVKYFGDWTSAIGKTIKYKNKYLIKITGVLQNVPDNTDFPLQLVISFATLKNTDLKRNLDDWVSIFSEAYCFVVLPSNLPFTRFNAYLGDFSKKHVPPEYAKSSSMILQHLSEMHYDNRLGVFTDRTFSKEIITTLSIIGLFLLVIACSNFINLATAQAVNRSKEVGVRKALGSRRPQLIIQFMVETTLITLVAVLFAIGLAFASMPFLNGLLQTHLHLNIIENPKIILFLACSTLLVSVLSGAYPAIVLSGFNPIQALKSKITRKSAGGISLRRALVVLQFCIAQVLIIGTMVVVSQVDLFRNASLGFNKEAIINISLPRDSSSFQKYNGLRNRLLEQSGIKNISFCFGSPSASGNWSSDLRYDNSPKKSDFGANLKWADADYFKTYDLHFIAGTAYKPSDTVNGFVVNQMFLNKLGIRRPEDAIGKYLDFWDKTLYAPIVGVIRDFNDKSLSKPITPIVLGSWKAVFQQVSIRIQPTKIKPVLASLEKIWNSTFPENYFEYHFLDQQIADFYKQENQLSELYKIFAGLAIFLSCFGLYGLVSFMAVQRTKEVGIRKVLGASVINILFLLSKEFTILIGLAFLISAPLSSYLMHRWLEQYSFRISFGPGLLVLAILTSITIAWLTIGYKTLKAALANPVNSLRTE